MPLIDSYIKTLLDSAGADGIGLASGHPVTLVFGSERKSVGPVIDLTRMQELVRDTFSAEERSAFVDTGRTERIHSTPAGAKLRITARSAHGGMQVMVSLMGKSAPAGPISLEGPPVSSPAPAPAPAFAPTPPPTESARPSSSSSSSSSPPAISTATLPPGEKPIDPLFRDLVKRGGSDLYVCTNKKPMIRKDGDLVAIGNNVLTDADVR